MGADYPDWGGQYNNANFYPLFDMAELAVRLGSIVAFDRRGSVVWMDSFEDGLDTFSTFKQLGTEIVGLVTKPRVNGAFACSLFLPNSVGAWVELRFAISQPTDQYLGVSTLVQTAGTSVHITLNQLIHRDGNQYTLSLRVNLVAPYKIELGHSGGYATLSEDSDLTERLSEWTFLKLVCDRTNLRGLRAVVGNQTFDISAYQMLFVGASSVPQWRSALIFSRSGGSGGTLYCDNVIMTSAEPANT